jgi:hypothetical protein
MAGLPKKYAEMGFKKGWAAYKKTKGAKPMAKSTKRRAASKAAPKKSSKKMGIMSRLTNINYKSQLIAGGYGVVRGQINRYNPLNRFFGKFGKYADELSLYALAQGIKAVIPKAKPYAHKAQDIEVFLMGFQASSDNDFLGKLLSGLGGNKESNEQGGNQQVYG